SAYSNPSHEPTYATPLTIAAEDTTELPVRAAHLTPSVGALAALMTASVFDPLRALSWRNVGQSCPGGGGGGLSATFSVADGADDPVTFEVRTVYAYVVPWTTLASSKFVAVRPAGP